MKQQDRCYVIVREADNPSVLKAYLGEKYSMFKACDQPKKKHEFKKRDPIQWRRVAREIDQAAEKGRVTVFMPLDAESGSYAGFSEYFGEMARHVQDNENIALYPLEWAPILGYAAKEPANIIKVDFRPVEESELELIAAEAGGN